MARNQELFEAVQNGDRKLVGDLVQQEIDRGTDPANVLDESLIPAMGDIGQKFSRGEIYVPGMLVAARAMQAGLDTIEPLLAQAGHKPRAKIAIGTVKGDLHDIGKNLVAIMLKGAGFQVEDLGVDCSVERFEEAVAGGAEILCLSALLTTTMSYMRDVISHFQGRNDVRFVVGGAPVTPRYAQEIGAHAYGEDANDAVRAVEECLQ